MAGSSMKTPVLNRLGRKYRDGIPRSMQGTRQSGREILENAESYSNIAHRAIPYNTMRPIVDTKTKNKSFLVVHRQLSMLGIRNNAFHLILLNPVLQGVDPYDPNLTPQEALMIVEECRQNVFYFLREVVRIPLQGSGTTMFQLDRATLAALYCFYNDINFYLMKPRQTGKSVGICAMLAWAFKFGTSNGQFFFSANTDKNVKENLRKMKQYISLLPSYLSKMGTQRRNSDGKMERKTDNITRYREPVNGNVAFCANRAITEEAAEEIGRGESHTFEFYDEAEFTPYIDTVVKVSGMAFNKAAQNSLDNGGHACRIFASTPGEMSDDKRCKRAMNIVNDALPWEEGLYDVDISDFKNRLAEKSAFKVVYIEYDYRSLGLGERWFRDACSNVGNDSAKIRREILLQRFSGSSMSPFSREDITELNENVIKPKWVLKIGPLYEINFFCKQEELKKTRMYFIGIDPSDGNGGDYYAMTIIDPYTLKTVAEFRSKWMTPQGLREMLEYLVSKYIPKVLISIENNRNGHTLIHFFDDSWLKPRLYAAPTANQDTEMITDKYDEKGFLINKIVQNKYYGINTSPTSRQMMMSLLVDTVNFRKDLLNTPFIVEDINGLVIKNNKIQAGDKKHDDMIMSWCIAMYTYYYGERLERFGFNKNSLPDDILEDDEFIKLKKLYSNPEIRKQFPTMYNFYMHELRSKLETEHRKTVAEKHHETSAPAIGSIRDEIQKSDPTYKGSPDSEETAVWKANIMNRWKRLNV